jgi:hypothetical protein
MMIGVWRRLVMRERMLAQHTHCRRYRGFQLWVVSFPYELRVLLHLDIRTDAVTFDLPLTVQSADRDSRRHNGTAVHQLRIAADADEPAPRAYPNERSELGFAEQLRHCITPRPRVLIDHHHFRAENGERRIQIR